MVIVRGATERRVSAAAAASFYEETTAAPLSARQAELRRLAGPVSLGRRPTRRPTKRDRRRYDAGRRRRKVGELPANRERFASVLRQESQYAKGGSTDE